MDNQLELNSRQHGFKTRQAFFVVGPTNISLVGKKFGRRSMYFAEMPSFDCENLSDKLSVLLSHTANFGNLFSVARACILPSHPQSPHRAFHKYSKPQRGTHSTILFATQIFHSNLEGENFGYI